MDISNSSQFLSPIKIEPGCDISSVEEQDIAEASRDNNTFTSEIAVKTERENEHVYEATQPGNPFLSPPNKLSFTESHHEKLLQGKNLVIKLERIDKALPVSCKYNFRKRKCTVLKQERLELSDDEEDHDFTSNAKVYKPLPDEDSDIPGSEVADKQHIKSKQNSHHSLNVKLKKYRGLFTCDICQMVKKYAANLAIHEAQEHANPANRKPGDRRHYCARCPYSVLSKQRYIIHHLKEHLGLLGVPTQTEQYKIRPARKRPKKTDLKPCDICQAPVPTDKTSTSSHFRNHHDTDRIEDKSKIERCCDCPAYFLRGIQLIRHKNQFHGGVVMSKSNKKRFPCKDCHKLFYYMPHLWAHRRDQCEMRHTFKWVANCEEEGCGLRFESTADLDHHVTNTHTNDMIKREPRICPKCGKMCATELGLHKHLKSHEYHDGDLNCKICGKITRSCTDLRRHMDSHLGPSSWRHQCEDCGRMCCTKSQLEVHRRTHSGEKPFSCDQCGDKFAYRYSLTAHVLQVHQGQEADKLPTTDNMALKNAEVTNEINMETFCPKCSKVFSTKQALQVHTRVHTGDTPFECHFCGDKFRYRHFLKSHLKVQHNSSGSKEDKKNGSSWKCSECDNKSFATKQALQVHSRIHTGETPFSCHVCGEKFRYSQLLKSHLNVKHTMGQVGEDSSICKVEAPKDGRWECSECDKSFATKQALQVHSRRHTGEKPFVCKVCGEAFRYRHVLRHHVNANHAEEGVKDLPRIYNKK